MGSNTNALLAILINQVAIPELTAWLLSRGKQPLDDAAILQKLVADTDAGIAIGQAWLAAHPSPTPAPGPAPVPATGGTNSIGG